MSGVTIKDEDWTVSPKRYTGMNAGPSSEGVQELAEKYVEKAKGDFPGTLSDSTRAKVLDEAKRAICGDRNNTYGPPTQDFSRTAMMASSVGFSFNGEALEAHHVAIFMVLLKTSRLAWSPEHQDSWIDIAGYAGCGAECVEEE